MQSESTRATMRHVAEAARVSVMTVSYVFNRPDRVAITTREKVMAAARSLGYTGPSPVARSLRYQTTHTLGVVLGERLTYAFEDPQAIVFLAGVASVCATRNFGLHIVPTTGDSDDSDRIAHAAVDAFVVWTTADDDPVLEAVRASGLPAVLHGGLPQEGFAFVGIDDRTAARDMAMTTFARSRHPAVLSFPVNRRRESYVTQGIEIDQVTFPVTRQRLLGYRDAAKDLSIPWSSVLVGVCDTNTVAAARELTSRMMASPHRIDAIAAMSDQQALGALRAAKAVERAVPQDMTLSGWDNSPVASEESISSVDQDLRAQGGVCASLALDRSLESCWADWSISIRASTSSSVGE
ncbi:MAG: LacI family DNA-binding transcriptional regulator [Rhodoglobus sp.]